MATGVVMACLELARVLVLTLVLSSGGDVVLVEGDVGGRNGKGAASFRTSPEVVVPIVVSVFDFAVAPVVSSEKNWENVFIDRRQDRKQNVR